MAKFSYYTVSMTDKNKRSKQVRLIAITEVYARSIKEAREYAFMLWYNNGSIDKMHKNYPSAKLTLQAVKGVLR